jgi:hypothetical protein
MNYQETIFKAFSSGAAKTTGSLAILVVFWKLFIDGSEQLIRDNRSNTLDEPNFKMLFENL